MSFLSATMLLALLRRMQPRCQQYRGGLHARVFGAEHADVVEVARVGAGHGLDLSKGPVVYAKYG